MKKIIKPVIITLILLAAATVGAYFLLTGSKSADNEFDSRRVNEQSDLEDSHAYRFDTDTTAIELVRTGDDKNVLNFEQTNIFTMANTENARARLDRLIKRSDASFDEPIIALNPFGTRPNSYYFYFKTPNRCMVRYTVTVPDENIKDHIRYVHNGTENNITNEHEFLVTGLVPGMTNYIILELVDENGSHREDLTYKVALPSAGIPSDIGYVTGRSEERLASGMYYMMPKKDKQIYTYDNNGVMRGTYATESAHGKRMYLMGNQFIYQIADNKVARTGKLGELTGVVSVSGGTIIDFSYDGFDNIFSLIKSKNKYNIVRTSFSTSKTEKVYTFAKGITPNSIASTPSGNLYISSASPSGIMRLDGPMSAKPKISVVYGLKKAWSKTKLKKKVSDPTAKKKKPVEESEDTDATSGEATDIETEQSDRAKAFDGWDLSDTILNMVTEESSTGLDVLSFAVKKGETVYAEKIDLNVSKPQATLDYEKELEDSGVVIVQSIGSHALVVGCSQGTYSEVDEAFKVARQYGFIREFDGVWKLDLTGFVNY